MPGSKSGHDGLGDLQAVCAVLRGKPDSPGLEPGIHASGRWYKLQELTGDTEHIGW
jgi:hypothetical protein